MQSRAGRTLHKIRQSDQPDAGRLGIAPWLKSLYIMLPTDCRVHSLSASVVLSVVQEEQDAPQTRPFAISIDCQNLITNQMNGLF